MMKMRASINTILLLVFLLSVVRTAVGQKDKNVDKIIINGGLRKNFYGRSCRNLESIVQSITWSKVRADATMAAKLLRLHYHDCFVRGCDASILIDPVNGDNTTEKNAIPNRSIAGYEVIDEIKATLVQKCRRAQVSCAHTIGVTHCPLISRRLYNFTGNGDTDPSLDQAYAAELKVRCPLPTNPATTVELDRHSSLSFDSNYFVGLSRKQGVLTSDAALLTNERAANLTESFKNFKTFVGAFGLSMVKMGGIGVLTGNQGEIRKNCRVIN
ncbi:Peroxidase [Trema orientale]|uniref:peroxidase n=1 Tax=Trema orientale TaxID=63057 RepID=A0A2P5ERT7_TREOI|nr:Peroxidase [Trema orientale]